MEVSTSEGVTQLRKLYCELGPLTRPDGSAILSQGGTTVLAGVYGPIEVKVQKVLIDKAAVEAHYRPKSGLPGIGDRFRESIIRNISETAIRAAVYPRSGISLIIQEMQDCGGLISCSVNAACLALMHSGIEMNFLVGAVSSMINNDNALILDPGHLELKNAKATFTFVFDSIEKNIVASHTTGSFNEAQYNESLINSRLASNALFDYYKNIFKQKYKLDE